MISESSPSKQKPAFQKGMLWFLFSGTAMASALLLPAHIIGSIGSPLQLNTWWLRTYFLILFFCILFHSLYRTKTILFDLGITKGQKYIGWILTIIFFAALSVSVYLLFLRG